MLASPTTFEKRSTHPSVVSGLGLIVLDELMFVDEAPHADVKVFATNHLVQIGGPVPTALAQLRRFGYAARFLGSWADNAHGRSMATHLDHSGIEFDRDACRTARTSGFAHVWIDTSTGHRTVVSVRPDGVPTGDAAVNFGRASRVLHLDGWGGNAAVQAAEATRAAGGLVTLDAGSPKPATEDLLPWVNVLNAPMRFLRAFCGTDDAAAGARQLLAAGLELVTVTDGDRGAGIYTKDVAEWQPAFCVRAVDTCGAGDVFCGGLIDAVLTKLEPVAALRFAMATAAIKVSRRGNSDALPSRDEVLQFLATQEPGA